MKDRDRISKRENLNCKNNSWTLPISKKLRKKNSAANGDRSLSETEHCGKRIKKKPLSRSPRFTEATTDPSLHS